MMPKTGKLEWGRYSEYISLKLLFDFERLSNKEERHIQGVFDKNLFFFLIAVGTAFLTPLVGLLQYKSVALFVIVTRIITISNTPTYHKQAHSVNSKMLACAVGCFVASSFQTWTHLSACDAAIWMLRLALATSAYGKATVSLPEYAKRIQNRFGGRTEKELKEEKKGLKKKKKAFNRLVLFAVGPVLACLTLVTFDLLLSYLTTYNFEMMFTLKTTAVLSILLFMNSQYIIAKSNYYDRDNSTQMLEMYAETVLSLYYLPKSTFFAVVGGKSSVSTDYK